ncbi:hypothetical protein AB205_0211510, partial [Aquarana catesbeiana]
MLVHDYDDERTLEEEEMKEDGKNFSSEIEDLEKEGNMPLEDLLAIYVYEPADPVMAGSSVGSSPSELADELPDMTLDKEEIAKDLLSGDDEETQSSADDLTPSVTSHETPDFFPRPLRSNTAYDGDREWESEDLETEIGNSSEDLRKEIMVGSQYQAEIPPFQGHYMADLSDYEHQDQLIWSPEVVPESKVEDFLLETMQMDKKNMHNRVSDGVIKDNEQALHELFKCEYDFPEAMERFCSRGVLHGKSSRLHWLLPVNSNKPYKERDYMDRLVDEAEALGGVEHPSALTCQNRSESMPDTQLNILNITANDLTALTHSVANVCNSTDVNCLNDGFPSLDSLPRGSVNHVPVGTEDLLNLPSNGESDCFTLFETGFYPPDLNPVSLCGEETERPAKRIKMGISVPEPFINDVSVNNLSVDFDNHAHHITSAKMAVSMADFSSLSANDTNSFISSHTLHHTALQSE